ncbi:MAG TPA: FAD-dependent oxidoreductase [Acidimicrobiales bacterium]|nr:FAD-dependent oxidoreductase [Acidimicrobiales bacterium]
MTGAVEGRPGVRRVVVVGAGIVGLSCAWSLQEHGVEVEVVDRRHAGAGSSWRNAGFISPALTVPLPEPSILRYGVRAVLDRHSPVALPVPPTGTVLAFLAGMVRNCTTARWQRAMAVYRPLNEQIFDAFDRQRAGGVEAATTEGNLVAGFREPADAVGLLTELQGVVGSGLEVDIDVLTGDQARVAEPHLSDAINTAVVVRGQRYITPSTYVTALADHVRFRGGKITEGAAVTSVDRRGDRVVVSSADHQLEADAVVLAAGSWMTPLARPHGVRVAVQAGRGYSFTAPCREPLRGPLYLPTTRVAITPEGERARLAGVMEFAGPDAAPFRGRIPSMVRAVRPLLRGVDIDDRADEWVGARPLTTDGMPLIGPTRTPGVYVAGGHGMWGVTLGPLTGRLLAEQIVTGRAPAELAPLDPRR